MPFARAGYHVTRSGRDLEVDLALTRLAFRGRNAALCVVTDVTGVAELERRFRLLVEHSADGITLVGEGGIVRYMSPGAERILGLEPGALLGTRALDNLHPDDDVTTPLKPGDTVVYTPRVRHTDGSWRWIESVATNLTHDPAVRAIVVNTRDITARHDAVLLMRRSEENFRRLIEGVPVAMFVHHDGVFVYVNPAAVAMLGYAQSSDLIGHSVLDFVHPDDHEMARRRIALPAFEGVSPRAEARMLRGDGSLAFCEGQGLDARLRRQAVVRRTRARHHRAPRAVREDGARRSHVVGRNARRGCRARDQQPACLCDEEHGAARTGAAEVARR